MTNILKEKIVDKFVTICTFKSIVNEYNMLLTEVINIFDEICHNLKALFYEVICLKIIDVLLLRTKPYLNEYFSKIFLKKHKKRLLLILFIIWNTYLKLFNLLEKEFYFSNDKDNKYFCILFDLEPNKLSILLKIDN